MSRSQDQAAAPIAAGQRTMITAAQLAGCGMGKDAIAHRVHGGRLHPEFNGVYSFGCGVLPALAREQAALLACGDGAFLSHLSAAFVWGFRKIAPPAIEVSVVGRGCRRRDGLHVHRIQTIDDREVRHHDGLWVSTPSRAVLEVAAVAPAELPGVIDAGLVLRILDRRDLERVLARNRPCRGAARLAAIVGDPDAMTLTRSKRERAFLRLMCQSGLPMPETNVKFGRYEADFLWRRERLEVEIDGYNYHTGPAVFSRDREKDLVFKEAGLDVLRFTGDHVLHQPTMVLVRVAQTLARRAASD